LTLARLDGTKWLVASLLYSTGMRLLEGLRLRVKDVEFERKEITVRDGKGAKDRHTMLFERLLEPLRTHVAKVRALHEQDLAAGFGDVYLPFALARKYPKAGRSWPWQYVFPSGSRYRAADRWTRSMALFAAIIWTNKSSSGRCPRTCFDTVLQLMFSPRVTTSAPCRSCSGTRTCRQR